MSLGISVRGTSVLLIAVAVGWQVGCQPSATSPAPVGNAEQVGDAGTEATMSEETQAVDRSHQVLRHAVFFAFNEASSAEEIQGVVDAFRALPGQIPEIIDFQWGTNNSPEGKDDGLTHCFLLTFQDEAGRDVYLPHDAHKAFGKVLGKHPTQIFVVDYWGTPYEPLERELKHAVFFKFKDDADPAKVKEVEQAFAALEHSIEDVKTFEWGLNNSPEGRNDDFTHCFMLGFASEEGRATYLPHAEHMKFVELVGPVVEKVRVLDFWGDK